jgi:hypothetical protein
MGVLTGNWKFNEMEKILSTRTPSRECRSDGEYLN